MFLTDQNIRGLLIFMLRGLYVESERMTREYPKVGHFDMVLGFLWCKKYPRKAGYQKTMAIRKDCQYTDF